MPFAKAPEPDFILFETKALKNLLRVGQECGEVQRYKTGGTTVCEDKIKIYFDRRNGFSYQIRDGCSNANHQLTFSTSLRLHGKVGCRVNRSVVDSFYLCDSL